jgi:hypothetical protein
MKKYKIEGSISAAFNRIINAEDIDNAWDIADEIRIEDVEDVDVIFPPYDVVIDEVEEYNE